MKKIKQTISFIIILFIAFLLVCPSSALKAANLKDSFNLSKEVGNAAGYNVGDAGNPLYSTISRVIRTALSFLGIVFMILMVYGGYVWMTARGNEQEVEKAKNTIMTAVIGLIIVASAYAISLFVADAIFKQTLK